MTHGSIKRVLTRDDCIGLPWLCGRLMLKPRRGEHQVLVEAESRTDPRRQLLQTCGQIVSDSL